MLRFAFNFNRTSDNELKREKILSRIRNACPHALAEPHDDGIMLTVTINSPMGTVNHICSQCGAVFYNNDVSWHVQRRYGSLEGLQQLIVDHEKFTKLLKKEGFIA